MSCDSTRSLWGVHPKQPCIFIHWMEGDEGTNHHWPKKGYHLCCSHIPIFQLFEKEMEVGIIHVELERTQVAMHSIPQLVQQGVAYLNHYEDERSSSLYRCNIFLEEMSQHLAMIVSAMEDVGRSINGMRNIIGR